MSMHSTTNQKFNWQAFQKRLQSNLTSDGLAKLAKTTGMPESAWSMLNPGWANANDMRVMHAGGNGWSVNYTSGVWTFPEYNGEGEMVGLSLLAEDNCKGLPTRSSGAHRGLVLPTNLHDCSEPVLIVESPLDVAACCVLGLTAVGRPYDRAGAADLAKVLEGRTVLVIGQRNGKKDGTWSGRDGAKAVAMQLAGAWVECVDWSIPPIGAMDLCGWLLDKIKNGLSVTNEQACRSAGYELLCALKQTSKQVKPKKKSQADALVELALSHFRLGKTDRKETFAVPKNGPSIALMFRGGVDALRKTLAKMYRQQFGKTPGSSALTDALTMLEGQAMDAETEPVEIRVSELTRGTLDHADVTDDADAVSETTFDGMALDLGDSSGRAVVINPMGWKVVDQSPVLFQRNALTGKLPTPADIHDPTALLELRNILNVTEDDWPLLVGWMVACFFPNIPHPVLMLGGEQGTGKSTAAKLLVGLIDPSPALLRSEPRDVEQWVIIAAGSWCVVIDNISHISGWLSDALCKAVTGDGWVRRKLYTDSESAVLSFQRCILLTSIDVGALRGDLGDRLLLVDLERIPDDQRRTAKDLEEKYRLQSPQLLAGLLSAVSRTLAQLPNVHLETMPRMADFARILAALDMGCPELTEGRALDLFMGQRQRIAGDVVDADPVAEAVIKLIEERKEWTGTASELLDALTPTDNDGRQRLPKRWPKSPNALAGHMKRILPSLRSVGIDANKERSTDRIRKKTWSIRQTASATVRTVRASDDSPFQAETADLNRTVYESQAVVIDHNRPALPLLESQNSAIADPSDDSDGLFPNPSDIVRYRI